MSISYKPLWRLLVDHDMNKGGLSEAVGIASPTIAKMGKNEYVSMEVLDRICSYFGCQLSDVVEIIHEESGLENEKE